MTYFADYLNALTSTEITEVKAAIAAKSPVQVLGQSGAAVSAPANDTNENILATISIAAGLMGANDSLEILTMWSYTASTNNKTLRIRLGGIGGTQYMNSPRNSGTEVGLQLMHFIRNRNSVSSQVGYQSGTFTFSAATAAATTSSVNMANAQDLVITGQKATGTETLTLESYRVLLLRAPA